MIWHRNLLLFGYPSIIHILSIWILVGAPYVCNCGAFVETDGDFVVVIIEAGVKVSEEYRPKSVVIEPVRNGLDAYEAVCLELDGV